ncbi:MAG: hypothetical protein ACR2PM_02850, partial [Hyphomicrobiales bacterium]
GAVHLAAMGFESIRLGSDPWPVETDLARRIAAQRAAPRPVEPAPRYVETMQRPVEPAPRLVEEPLEDEPPEGSVAALARQFARFRAMADQDANETA